MSAKKHKVETYLDEGLYQKLQKYSDTNEVPFSWIIFLALKKFLDRFLESHQREKDLLDSTEIISLQNQIDTESYSIFQLKEKQEILSKAIQDLQADLTETESTVREHEAFISNLKVNGDSS